VDIALAGPVSSPSPAVKLWKRAICLRLPLILAPVDMVPRVGFRAFSLDSKGLFVPSFFEHLFLIGFTVNGVFKFEQIRDHLLGKKVLTHFTDQGINYRSL